jgi:hypothetical protein
VPHARHSHAAVLGYQDPRACVRTQAARLSRALASPPLIAGCPPTLPRCTIASRPWTARYSRARAHPQPTAKGRALALPKPRHRDLALPHAAMPRRGSGMPAPRTRHGYAQTRDAESPRVGRTATRSSRARLSPCLPRRRPVGATPRPCHGFAVCGDHAPTPQHHVRVVARLVQPFVGRPGRTLHTHTGPRAYGPAQAQATPDLAATPDPKRDLQAGPACQGEQRALPPGSTLLGGGRKWIMGRPAKWSRPAEPQAELTRMSQARPSWALSRPNCFRPRNRS